jgi:hypothetical protein
MIVRPPLWFKAAFALMVVGLLTVTVGVFSGLYWLVTR